MSWYAAGITKSLAVPGHLVQNKEGVNTSRRQATSCD